MSLHLWAIVLIVGSQGADWWSTHRALATGAVEANPLVRRLGIAPVKIGTAVLMSLVTLRLSPTAAFVLGSAIAAMYSLVVHHNLGLSPKE